MFKKLHILYNYFKSFIFSLTDNSIEFACGCLSGWAQVLTMQPFELIKIRLANQSLLNPIYNGIHHCLTTIVKQQGITTFYKGTLSPLLGVGAQVALQFGTNQLVKKMLLKFHLEDTQQGKLPISFIFLSGLVTGLPSSLLVTPIDHMRIKMQRKQNVQYSSSIKVGLQITKKYGINGIYLGFYPTILREVISLGIYFANYQLLTRQMLKNDIDDYKLAVSFIAGGLSGALSWFFTYPLDYTKTLVQSDELQKRKYTSATNAAMIKYKEQGGRTFFKGMGVCMLRSFPVNGIGFVTFEYFKKALSEKYKISQ